MADEDQNAQHSTATTPTAPATQSAPTPSPAAPGPRMYSADEVLAAANSAAAAARREAEAKLKAPTAPPTKSETATAAPVSADEIERAMDRKIEFATGLGRVSQLNGWSAEVESKVRTLFKAENPGNVSEWLGQTAQLFGGKTVSSTPASPKQDASAQPSVPAPIAPSAPSTSVPLQRDVDIFSMDAAGVHELMRKSGASDPGRPYDPKNRAGSRAVRILVEEALRTRRVKLGSK